MGDFAERCRHDSRFEKAGFVEHGDREAARHQPTDGHAPFAAWSRGAELWAEAAQAAAARAVRGLSSRPRDGLARSFGAAPVSRSRAAGLHRWLFGADQLSARGAAAVGPALRASLRDTARPAGAGRLRLFRGRVHRRPWGEAGGMVVHHGARLQPFSLGPVLSEPEARHSIALPYSGVRGARRGSRGDPLRSHEDGGAGQRRGGSRDLQPVARRPRQSPNAVAEGATNRGPVSRTGPRPRARSSDPTAMSARISSSPAAFAISTI